MTHALPLPELAGGVFFYLFIYLHFKMCTGCGAGADLVMEAAKAAALLKIFYKLPTSTHSKATRNWKFFYYTHTSPFQTPRVLKSFSDKL